MNLSGLYYGLLFIGFLLVFIPPVVTISQQKKLEKEDYAVQIFLPQTIGLLLLFGGFWGSMKEFTDEHAWHLIIPATAGGAMLYSIVAAFQSIILIRWRSD